MRGRWAPSPTGAVHLGNARTALVAWLSVRARGGQLIWRVEDLDQQRVVDGRARSQARDLAWLGIDWDEGPWADSTSELLVSTDSPNGDPVDGDWWQSQRGDLYVAALRRLQAAGRLFPCRLSRREIAGIASAPHGSVAGACGVGARASRYPPSARPDLELNPLPEDWLERLLPISQKARRSPADASVRFLVEPEEVVFEDLLYGEIRDDPSQTVGDFVLLRRDGVWAYHLAVVVDDAAMEIDEVVRGADLLDSTAQQNLLQRALGVPTPRYGHVPLLLNEAGEKLNKRDGALEVAQLRRRGVEARWVVGYLAQSLGLSETLRPVSPHDLVERFAWRRLRREPVRVPENLADRLRQAMAQG